jgi:predicted Zn-ribbon and HTH transcriptional regulator
MVSGKQSDDKNPILLRPLRQKEGEYLSLYLHIFRNRNAIKKVISIFSERHGMPTRYCRQCGAELSDDASYCPECGSTVGEVHEPDTTNKEISTDGDSWDWSNPRGLQSPRQALGTLNMIGFVSMLVAIGLNAIGLPITVFPHPLPIAMFVFWLGILVIGLPLWGLLHIVDNVLGFHKAE